MDLFICMLLSVVSVQLISDVRIFWKICHGESALSDGGWFADNFIICILGIILILVGFGLFTDISKDASGGVFFLSIMLFLGNLMIITVIHNYILNDYNNYKKWCFRTGLDLRDHINKYVVLTNKCDYYKQKQKDGVIRDNTVKLFKVIYNKCWLGEFPYLSEISNLAILSDIELDKDNISEYVHKYFKGRGQYLVEGDNLTSIETGYIDVIKVKL